MTLIEPGVCAIVLAPMEGVTDAPMRALLTERAGFTLCVAEFLRISQGIPPDKTYVKHMPEFLTACSTATGVPVQFQLLGGDPELLAQAAQRACALGAVGIDLNFGCPANTVNRRDGGASLLKDPARLRRIVSAVRSVVPRHIPVSAKLRLGWDDPFEVHHNSDMAAEGGAAWITLHGRTRTQNYKPWARWRPIGEVRRRLPIPVVANGDLWTVQDVLRCAAETGCIHFMLGRGAMARPSLAGEVALALHIFHAPQTQQADTWAERFKRLVALARRPEQRPGFLPGRLKQWAAMANARTPNAWYPAIKRLQTVDEILDVLTSMHNPDDARESMSAPATR